MARYKAIDTSPRFLAVDLEKQLLPGSFEHAVHHLLECEFDLSIFAMGSRGKQERPKALQTNPPSQETSLTFPVDRENGIKMKNGADHCCATLLSDFRLKTGFSTASTSEITGLRCLLRRSGGLMG